MPIICLTPDKKPTLYPFPTRPPLYLAHRLWLVVNFPVNLATFLAKRSLPASIIPSTAIYLGTTQPLYYTSTTYSQHLFTPSEKARSMT